MSSWLWLAVVVTAAAVPLWCRAQSGGSVEQTSTPLTGSCSSSEDVTCEASQEGLFSSGGELINELSGETCRFDPRYPCSGDIETSIGLCMDEVCVAVDPNQYWQPFLFQLFK